MAVKAKEPKRQVDSNYLGCFRVVLSDSVLSVIRSYQRIDSRLRGLKFGECCQVLEAELRESKKTNWRYYQFFAAEGTRGRVSVPLEMIEREFEMFVGNNQSLRFEAVQDNYGLDVIKLYRRVEK